MRERQQLDDGINSVRAFEQQMQDAIDLIELGEEEGDADIVKEAEDALREPFIDEYCESTGNFRVHNFDEIEVAGGIALGDLAVSMVEDAVFEISSQNSTRHMNEQRAKLLADALKRHDMFEEVRIEVVS